MANYLLTGARAPATLELARNLSRHGHQVCAADSLAYPLTGFSNSLRSYTRISAPRSGIDKFQSDLQKVIAEHQIDFLIPTCEEVFYISRIKHLLEDQCQVFCPDFELIKRLHSKFEVLKMAGECVVEVPESSLVDSKTLAGTQNFDGLVVKPEFGRFGTDVLMHPDQKNIGKLIRSRQGQFVVQEKIGGAEICTYCVAVSGDLKLHVSYQLPHRLRKSAAVYFQPVVNPKITEFVTEFVRRHNITGQLGFDFIERDGQVYLVECNPRATSGVHLVAHTDIAACIEGKRECIDPSAAAPAMIAFAMLIFCLPQNLKIKNISQIWTDFRKAKDVINCHNDRRPSILQMMSFLEIGLSALSSRKSILAASTKDIEWNGGKAI